MDPDCPSDEEWRAALAIVDRISLLLAPTLPGCTPRRYDFPLYDDYSPITLCFTDRGPIAVNLGVGPSKRLGFARAAFSYRLMLREARDFGAGFDGPSLHAISEFSLPPEAMAKKILGAITEADVVEAIAGASIERILVDTPRYKVPWPNLHLAVCAVYLGRDQEAISLLTDVVRYALKDGSPVYAKVVAIAETYMAKLKSDADGLRHELIATMEYNWAHFKIVRT